MATPRPALSAGRAAVLFAVLRGAVTVTDVTAAAGFRSRGTVHRHLECLRADGLVTWEPGRGGTLRPNVQVVAASPIHD